jgi:NAD+ synthase (glutamine-hydrolysing)
VPLPLADPHQSAPGPKVSRRAFGRERRYPITSGYWA